MPFIIEHDVPLPRGHQTTDGRMAELRATFTNMVPGDSFVYNCTALTHAYQAAKQVCVKITTRKLLKGGFRVWRKA